MNTNSNNYTFFYASVMVVLVAAALAFTNGVLKDKQAKNVEVDKMQQILRALKMDVTYDLTAKLYKQTVQTTYLINSKGEKIDTNAVNAFHTDISKEVLKPLESRKLPVYEALVNGDKKIIIPVYGAGLWGPIWGYVALNSDKKTIFAASFSHQGETPGLGAEISSYPFQHQFEGKKLFNQTGFVSVAVVKSGKMVENMDQVDGISGGTITSQGVQNMLFNCLSAYETFLKATSL